MSNDQAISAVDDAIREAVFKHFDTYLVNGGREIGAAAVKAYHAAIAKPGVLLDARNEDAINYYGPAL